MRILHLIDAASPQASGTTVALLRQAVESGSAEDQHLVVAVADDALSRRLTGFDWPADRCSIVHGRGVVARWPGVRRRLINLGWTAPDLIHCWSLAAFSLASLIYSAKPCALTITLPMPVRHAHWLRYCLGARQAPAAVLAVSSTLRRELLIHGLPETAVHTLRPGLDLSMCDHQNRAAHREGWDAGAPGDVVVALLADPPGELPGLTGMMACGIADQAGSGRGRRVIVLVPPGTKGLDRASALARDFNWADHLVVEPLLDAPWRVLPSCDAALSIGDNSGGLSLLWAMASGTPVVAGARYAVAEVVEDRHSALLARDDDQVALSRRLAQALDDREMSWKVRDTARHEAFSYFSRQRYQQNLSQVHRALAGGRAVEIPPMESTGGLRFAGRA